MSLPSPSDSARALITGASQGIGKAIARDLAKLGHSLILVARREYILRDLAEEFTRLYGVSVEVRPCDLSDRQARSELIQEIKQREINIIVNSAGVATFGPFITQDWDAEQKQFELNATAVFELTQAVLPGMLERHTGAILNVGSTAGNVPIPNNATYVFTKAGVNTFTEALHYELRGTGVSCTLLAPGPVREAYIPPEEITIVDRVVPGFLWTTYESCSVETLAALAANRRRVVPGPLSKLMHIITVVFPTSIIAPLVGRVYKKMDQ
ncbi:mycolate reductase [Corynebacterium freiburgense]|uniref:mycolate reductase n=1 Tax=Corynebacterium freiburgense TaxID=556548 RepID=UPI0004131609|nr:mycolate reductase [Corynebacterium freiburgense]WJZ03450.1 NADP-dependent 3-hydroxy acid dehydrogenase YdfG [Corynebacterium freiburgense]